VCGPAAPSAVTAPSTLLTSTSLTRRAAQAGLSTPLLDLATLALRIHERRLGPPPGT